MASDYDSGGSERGRRRRGGDLLPSWLWVAVPFFIVVVVGGLWWGLFSPSQEPDASQPTVSAMSTATERAIPTRDRSTTPTTVVLIRSTATPTTKPTATVPTTITKGYRVKVIGTEGAGLNLRSAPGVNKDLVKTVEDGAILMVLAGPLEEDDFEWWQLQDESGTVGWGAAGWLALYLD